jgi:phosphohistidine phosphatase
LKIFLVRHGDADAEIPEALGDEGRALTAKARNTLIAHFSSLSDRMGGAELILTSPLVRAVQTAQILSIVNKHEGLLHAHRSLVPEMPVGALDAVIRDNAGKDLILVGHQPSMGALAAHLLTLQSFPRQVSPGTVIALERKLEEDGAPTRLLFFAPPGQPVLEEL